jgi:hypothetical protein
MLRHNVAVYDAEAEADRCLYRRLEKLLSRLGTELC